jgi:WD40 repeat protein
MPGANFPSEDQPRPRTSGRKRWALWLAPIFLALLAGCLLWGFTRPPGPPLVATLRADGDPYLGDVQFSPDGKTVGAGGAGGLTLWETTTWQVHAFIPGPGPASPSRFSFAPDGQSLAAPTGDAVWQWDLSTEKSKLSQARLKDAFALAFSPDGKILAFGGDGGPVKLVDTATGTELATLKGERFIRSLAFSPDGQTLAAADNDGRSPSVFSIRLWDVADRRERAVLRPSTHDVIHTVIFSPDGKTLASGGFDDMIRLWDPATGQPLSSWKAGLGSLNCLAFSPGGKVLLAGGGPENLEGLALWPGKVKFFDAASGKELRTLNAHENMIRSMALSPDGKLLAVDCEAGKTVKVWDVSALTGK